MVETLNNGNIKILKPTSPSYRQRNGSSPVILIVDNDDDNRAMLKLLLEMWKYQVIEAKDGAEVISIAEKSCPDLIVMDVILPLLDGFDATRKIRQSAAVKSVPVVFLSGCAEAVYKQKGAAVGGNAYLVKPLDFNELEVTLDQYISRPTETLM